MKYFTFIFLMLLVASCWGQALHVTTNSAKTDCDSMKYFPPFVPYDTTRFYPVIDTVKFVCEKWFTRPSGDSGHKWIPVLDTIWKPKIQVFLTPDEWKKLQELLHPGFVIYNSLSLISSDETDSLPKFR